MMLGKRKRDTKVVRRDVGTTSLEPTDTLTTASQDIFQQYFEAAFDPLPADNTATPSLDNDISGSENNENSDGDDDDADVSEGADDFSGFSDEEETIVPVIEVVDTATGLPEESNSIDKIFKKSFMSSKPPRDIDSSSTQTKTARHKPTTKDDEDDITNLKNDIDLQRLLRESHLLSQNVMSLGSGTKSKTDPTTLHGRPRHEATDLRLLELGSKRSLFTQEKMPMSHRKGIKSKINTTEERRRRDARENGVILERSKSKKDARSVLRRDRGVDAPALGRFRGGTLSLSKKDIASIQGPSAKSGKKKGRR